VQNVLDSGNASIDADMKGANPDEFTPLEIVVNKILEQGYELESLYH